MRAIGNKFVAAIYAIMNSRGQKYTSVFFLLVWLLSIATVACSPVDREASLPTKKKAPAEKTDTSTASVQDTSFYELPLTTHHATIRTTLGKAELELYGNDAPLAVENFEKLAQKRYYDRQHIHRIARDFVVQMGDQRTRNLKKVEDWGFGGESAFGAPFDDELDTTTKAYQLGYRRGVVAMANGAANDNTSQFFICLTDQPNLERHFTIFGKVTKGMDIFDSMNTLPLVPVLDSTDGRPLKPIRIHSIRVKKILK